MRTQSSTNEMRTKWEEGGLINLPRHWTFSLKAYCYHKSVSVHSSIASVRDFLARDLIASIQLSRLIWNSFRCWDARALQMNPLPSRKNCPKCNQHSKLLDHRCGSCGIGERRRIHFPLSDTNWNCSSWTEAEFGIHLNEIWCHCKSNKFNFIENISDLLSFSWTTFMPFSNKLMVRLDCLSLDLSDIRCWFSEKGKLSANWNENFHIIDEKQMCLRLSPYVI